MKRTILLLTAAILIAGCEAAKREFVYQGGNVAYYTDEIWYNANTDLMETYRGTVIIAALSKMAERNVTDPKDAVNAVNNINQAISVITRMHRLAASTCGLDGIGDVSYTSTGDKYMDSVLAGQCSENAYRTSFEAKIIDLQNAVFRLFDPAFSIESLRNVKERAVKGDAMGTLWAAMWSAAEVADTARYGAGAIRESNSERAITLKLSAQEYRNKILERNPLDRKFIDAATQQSDEIEREVNKALSKRSMEQYEVMKKFDKFLFDIPQNPKPFAFLALYASIRESCERIWLRMPSNMRRTSGDGATPMQCAKEFLGITPSSDGLYWD